MYQLIFTLKTTSIVAMGQLENTELEKQSRPLCEHCVKYKTSHERGFENFDNAWPRVLWSYLSKGGDESCQLWKLLPVTMKESWLHTNCLENINFHQSINFVTVSVLQDLTHNLKGFNTFKETWDSSKMRNKLNENFFSNCEMSCGVLGSRTSLWQIVIQISTLTSVSFITFIQCQFLNTFSRNSRRLF